MSMYVTPLHSRVPRSVRCCTPGSVVLYLLLLPGPHTRHANANKKNTNTAQGCYNDPCITWFAGLCCEADTQQGRCRPRHVKAVDETYGGRGCFGFPLVMFTTHIFSHSALWESAHSRTTPTHTHTPTFSRHKLLCTQRLLQRPCDNGSGLQRCPRAHPPPPRPLTPFPQPPAASPCLAPHTPHGTHKRGSLLPSCDQSACNPPTPLLPPATFGNVFWAGAQLF